MKAYCALFCLAASLQAQVLLTDDFDTPTINGFWTVVRPLPTSSVIPNQGGGMTTTGRGILGTAAGFRAPHVITGTFTPLHGLEHFNVVLRSDLGAISGNQFGGRTGINVQFVCDGSGINIQRWPADGNWTQLATTFFRLPAGRAYSFAITDTGSKISVAINGIERLSAETDFRTGDRIAFHSREFPQTGTRIEGVTISAVPPPSPPTVITIPDTSGRLVNMSTLGSGGFTMGFVVGGSSPKMVLVRAVGPTLSSFGVEGAASQTTLTLRRSNVVIASSTRWGSAPNASQIALVPGPFALPAGSADSAILLSLVPASYTAQVSSDGATLLEAYEVSSP